MFGLAYLFNQDISGWDTHLVTDMSNTFRTAINFNANIAGWNTSAATNMSAMFYSAFSFDRNIGSWNMLSVTTVGSMFTSAGPSSSNYDALLNGWAAQNVLTGKSFAGGLSVYTSASTAARATLTGTKTWTITDGGAI